MSNKICSVCRTKLNVSDHHIIPQSEGGGDERSNLMALCSACHDYIEIHTAIPRTRSDCLVVGMERIDRDPNNRRKKCENCQRQFISSRKDQIYCSSNCRTSIAHKRKRIIFSPDCAYCNSPLTPGHYYRDRNTDKRYCSKRCKIEAKAQGQNVDVFEAGLEKWGVVQTDKKQPHYRMKNVNVSRDIRGLICPICNKPKPATFVRFVSGYEGFVHKDCLSDVDVWACDHLLHRPDTTCTQMKAIA